MDRPKTNDVILVFEQNFCFREVIVKRVKSGGNALFPIKHFSFLFF